MRILVVHHEPTRRGPGRHLDGAVDDGDNAHNSEDHDDRQGEAEAKAPRSPQATGAPLRDDGADAPDDGAHRDHAASAGNDHDPRGDDDAYRDDTPAAAPNDHHSLRPAASDDHDSLCSAASDDHHPLQHDRRRLHPAERRW